MKTIFDEDTRAGVIGRINNLGKDSQRQWGKMTPFQMVQHCISWEDMAQGRKKYKQVFIGRLFGKVALRDFMKDKPMGRNAPTLRDLKMQGDGDIEAAKTKWISLLADYGHFSNDNFIHPFFGKMTTEQIGQMAYKHLDHHLRQFGC